jgi:hypothetical protein
MLICTFNFTKIQFFFITNKLMVTLLLICEKKVKCLQKSKVLIANANCTRRNKHVDQRTRR